MNKEKDFWNNKGTDLYNSGKYDDTNISSYEFGVLERLNINFGTVLEIGPGSGRDIRKFKELGFNLSAIDISKKFIRDLNASQVGRFVEGDLRDISNLFSNIDLIYSRWSILFLKYDEFKKFLISSAKVLNEGGCILMSLRAGDSLENIHSSTGLQSLQMNVYNLIKALPINLELLFVEVISYESTRSSEDKQICFVIKKKSKDKRNGIYKG